MITLLTGAILIFFGYIFYKKYIRIKARSLDKALEVEKDVDYALEINKIRERLERKLKEIREEEDQIGGNVE